MGLWTAPGWAGRECSAGALGIDHGDGATCSLGGRKPTARVGEEAWPGLRVCGLDAIRAERLPRGPEGVRRALPG